MGRVILVFSHGLHGLRTRILFICVNPCNPWLNSLSAELLKEWSQRCDDLIVRRAVAGDESVPVLHVGNVVVQRIAEKIGYTPARFAQYVRDEVAIWVPMVKASGARVE